MGHGGAGGHQGIIPGPAVIWVRPPRPSGPVGRQGRDSRGLWWLSGQPSLVGHQFQQQHLVKPVQAQARLAAHLAGTPPHPEHRPRTTAGPTPTPLINSMIHQQRIQGDHRPTLDRADPIRGTPPGPFLVRHDRAQHLAQRVATGLVPRRATADHRPHPATVCHATDRIGCSRGSHSEPLSTFMLGTDTPTGTVPPFLVAVITG